MVHCLSHCSIDPLNDVLHLSLADKVRLTRVLAITIALALVIGIAIALATGLVLAVGLALASGSGSGSGFVALTSSSLADGLSLI